MMYTELSPISSIIGAKPVLLTRERIDLFHGRIAWKKLVDNPTSFQWMAYLNTYNDSQFNLIVVEDITKQFNSPFYLTSYAVFPIINSTDHGGRNKEIIQLLNSITDNKNIQERNGKFDIHRKLFYGMDSNFPRKFKEITRTNDCMWMVSNRHPDIIRPPEHIDSFYGAFSEVPLSMLKRYWNKSVNLNSKPRMSNKKSHRSFSTNHTWLDFMPMCVNQKYLPEKEIRVFFRDSLQGIVDKRLREHQDYLAFREWLQDNKVKKIRPLSGNPFFTKEEEDFVFLMDIAQY